MVMSMPNWQNPKTFWWLWFAFGQGVIQMLSNPRPDTHAPKNNFSASGWQRSNWIFFAQDTTWVHWRGFRVGRDPRPPGPPLDKKNFKLFGTKLSNWRTNTFLSTLGHKRSSAQGNCRCNYFGSQSKVIDAENPVLTWITCSKQLFPFFSFLHIWLPGKCCQLNCKPWECFQRLFIWMKHQWNINTLSSLVAEILLFQSCPWGGMGQDGTGHLAWGTIYISDIGHRRSHLRYCIQPNIHDLSPNFYSDLSTGGTGWDRVGWDILSKMPILAVRHKIWDAIFSPTWMNCLGLDIKSGLPPPNCSQ